MATSFGSQFATRLPRAEQRRQAPITKRAVAADELRRDNTGRLTATIPQAIADPDTLRTAVQAGTVVTWAHEAYPAPPQADPTGTPTHAPPTPAAC